MVEEANSFLEGSDGLIKNGFRKLEQRQLGHLGWAVKKYNIKSWIKLGQLDILPK